MVADRIYKVNILDFRNMSIEATETDLSVCDVSGNEIFSTQEFREFRIKLINGNRKGNVIDFVEWVGKYRGVK